MWILLGLAVQNSLVYCFRAGPEVAQSWVIKKGILAELTLLFVFLSE